MNGIIDYALTRPEVVCKLFNNPLPQISFYRGE